MNKPQYNCPFDYKCVLPRAEYRCNKAYEHCIVYQRFNTLKPSQEKPDITKVFYDEDMKDF